MGGFTFGPVALDFRRSGAAGSARVDAAATLGRPASWVSNLLAPWPAMTGSIYINGTTPWITVNSLAQPTSVLGFPVDALDFTVNLSRGQANGTLSASVSGTATASLPVTFYLLEFVKNGCCFDPPFCNKRFDCNLWIGHNTVDFDLW